MPRGSLRDYHAKRDFSRTAEPKGTVTKRKAGKLRYLIQKHAARHTHYDVRLEWNGTLLSWAVPRGPSENPDDKRLAVHVEDHPVEYGSFEGTIPKGEYGGGTVMLWDTGTWVPHESDVDASLEKGKLGFELYGKRLKGNWAFVKLRKRSPRDKDNWLLIKELDEYVRKTGPLIVDRETTSVKSGRAMDEIAAGKSVWHSNRRNGRGDDDPVILARPASGSKKKPASAPQVSARGASRSAASLPAFVEPQLATLVDAPPSGDDWLHEIKYDGYRALAALAGDRIAIYTRTGLDWTDRFRPLVPALQRVPCASALLDGEIAVADARGHTDFGALQEALSTGKGRLAYYLFDLLQLDGQDLRRRPLSERKEALRALLAKAGQDGPLIYSDHVGGNADAVFAQARALKLEGLISKRADAPYRSGRTQSWLKSKIGFEQEFVIIGWRPSDKAGRPFSSLLLAVRDDGALRYAGRVGSGLSGEGLDALAAKFRALARKTPPVSDIPQEIRRDARFVEPELVAEIEFRGWTRDNVVRQAAFKGLRSDKAPTEIVKEEPMPIRKATNAAAKSAARPARKSAGTAPRVAVRSGEDVEDIAGVRVTHPDRVLYPAQGITKRDIIAHYLSIADAMLPHVAERPLSLVRAPRGVGGEQFYQKHASEGFPDQFKAIKIKEKSGTDDYLYIEDERGLVAAVQMGVLELHPWGCHVDEVEKPDRLIFDFDPDEDLGFAQVRDAAKDMRDRLKQLGLESFPMVTGGKGVHVIVPLKRGHSWDQHRDFAEALARVMAEEEPDRFVANMSKKKRRGKIFVDYLRNQRGATAICPFSTRARPGAFVAMPVSWAKLSRLADAHPVRVGEARAFLGRSDPWPGYFTQKQALPGFK